MKISLVQVEIGLGEVLHNRQTVERMVAKAMQDNPDVLVLPELWDIGFFPKDIGAYADADGKIAKDFLSSLAAGYKVNIVGGSVAAEVNGAVYNTNYTFNRQGELMASYCKSHLFSPAQEDKFFSPGNSLYPFEVDGVRAAVVICYDIRFCEWIRLLTLDGIKVLFVVAAWPVQRLAHWRTLLAARAIENQIFVAAVNSCGTAGRIKFCGHSMAIDPWGEVLAEAGDSEGVFCADFDVMVTDEIRNKINVFQDRRGDLYKIDKVLS